jgi:ubiquinone/menaquinone biosynthesis C-methylase UbiE
VVVPDLDRIYQQENARYDRLISREDYQGNLLRTLSALIPLQGVVAVDTGAGTGRLSRLLPPIARQVYAFDHSRHMLETAAARLFRIVRASAGLLNRCSLSLTSAAPARAERPHAGSGCQTT